MSEIGKQVPVLIVSPWEEDGQLLEQVLRQDPKWDVQWAGTPERALAQLRWDPIPLVLLDCSASADWQDTVRSLLSVSHPVCLLLLSFQIDYNLWEKLVQLGGFDVLGKPFDPNRLLRTLQFAIDRWHGGLIRRTLENAA